MSQLESRFRSFLAGRPGALDRDADPQLAGSERADFVVGTLICEIKSIRVDTTRKIPRVLSQYGLVPLDGRYTLSALLAGRNDAAEIEKAVWSVICSDLETDIRKANSQILAEKGRVGGDTTGVLVLVNDVVADLHPELLLHGIGQKLRKTRENNARFPHVNIVWLISEVFPLEANNVRAFLAHAPNPLVPTSAEGLEAIRHLNAEWQKQYSEPPN